MVQTRALTLPSAGGDVEQWNRLLLTGTQDSAATLENSSVFLTKLNLLFYEPVATSLGIYPKVLKTFIHTTTYTQMLKVALFIIVKA
jgi:hypothetical protein